MTAPPVASPPAGDAREGPPLLIDAASRRASLDGRPLACQGRAFDLLMLLASRPGEVFEIDELLRAIWPQRRVEPANLRVQVNVLRRELGTEAVRNVAARGYVLTLPVVHRQAKAASTRPLRAPLPPPASALLGRDAELQQLSSLLQSHRLVSLLGAGGIGKTRLAQEMAQAGQHMLAGGAVWVDLAQLQAGPEAGAALCQAVAQACRLQLPAVKGAQPAALLAGALASATEDDALLLVLDNAEHLVDVVVPLVSALLLAAPRLRLLVTSQRPLQLTAEQACWLDTLAVPPEGADAESVRASPSVQLLLRRAAAADPRWSPSAAEWPALGRLVRALDGMPLALEMAAVRLPLLGPTTLEQRMGERLRLLARPAAVGDTRHATLRALLDWSHGLLDPLAQRALRQLSVFAGPFRLDAALEVVELDGSDPAAAESALQVLLAHSLLQLEPAGGGERPARLRLLETTRLYAAEALQRAPQGERAACEQRHGRVLAALAQRAVEHLYRASDADWLACWGPDHHDFTTAFDRAHARGDADTAAAVIEVLVLGANVSGNIQPALSRWQATRDLASDAAPLARARLLGWGNLAAGPGQTRRAQSEQRVRAWRALPPGQGRAGLCVSLAMHAALCQETGDAEAADAALVECQALERADWPPRLRRRCAWIALTRMSVGRDDPRLLAQAQVLTQVLRAELSRQGAWHEVSLLQGQQAQMLRLQGQHDAAADLLQATAQLQLDLGSSLDAGRSLGLACAARLQAADADDPGAGPVLAAASDDAVQALRRIEPHPAQLHYFIDALADLAWRRGRPDAAAQLLAGGERMRRDLDLGREPLGERVADALRRRLHQQVELTALARWQAQGEELDAGALRQLALAVLRTEAVLPPGRGG